MMIRWRLLRFVSLQNTTRIRGTPTLKVELKVTATRKEEKKDTVVKANASSALNSDLIF